MGAGDPPHFLFRKTISNQRANVFAYDESNEINGLPRSFTNRRRQFLPGRKRAPHKRYT
jgi:hypothetical protein